MPDRQSWDAFARLDAAFKSGDLAALRAELGDPAGFPNLRAPHEAIACSLLQYAIYHSPLGFIRELLELGADPNYDDFDGFPSLMAALSCRPRPGTRGRDDIVALMALLLDHGAGVNQRGINDYTPLHSAAEAGDLAAVELLLSRGADASLRTRIDDLQTAAEVAALAGHDHIAALLRRAEGA